MNGSSALSPYRDADVPVLLAFTLLILLLTCAFHDPLGKMRPVVRIHGWLHRLRPHTEVILRIGLAIGLVLQLLSGSYLAPEFRTNSMWIILGLSAAAACLSINAPCR